jgi:hypothetical protein
MICGGRCGMTTDRAIIPAMTAMMPMMMRGSIGVFLLPSVHGPVLPGGSGDMLRVSNEARSIRLHAAGGLCSVTLGVLIAVLIRRA